MESDAPRVKAHKGKGTTTVTLDFDDSDDVFYEEAENARASRLTESTIDVNTGEKVACQLEKVFLRVSLLIIFLLFVFEFYVSILLILNFAYFLLQKNFS